MVLNLLLIKLYMKTEAGGYYPDKEDILIDQGLKLHGLFRILGALLLYKLLRTVFYFKLFIVSQLCSVDITSSFLHLYSTHFLPYPTGKFQVSLKNQLKHHLL